MELINCVIDTSVLLDFYRHVSDTDYFPEANAIIQQAIKSFSGLYGEFLVGHSQFASVLRTQTEFAKKLRLVASKEADGYMDALSAEQEEQLVQLCERVASDPELLALRAMHASDYVRPLQDEVGYVLRLAIMGNALRAVVVVAPHRFPIAQAMNRCTGGIEETELWEMQTSVATIAGMSVMFASILTESKAGRQLGYSLVMRGGGIKGIAYAGALQELDPYYAFDTFVGTSAGSIAAALLAAGWNPVELETLLAGVQLREFVSLNPFAILSNLMFHGGLFSGERLQDWVERKLREKTGLYRQVLFSDIGCRLEIVVSTRNRGTVVFSRSSHPKSSVSFAIRCSSAIPFFFIPCDWEGGVAQDGGVKDNLPIQPYFDAGGDERVLVLSVSDRAENNSRTEIPLVRVARGLLGSWIDQDEESLARAPKSSVIMIDTGPIKSTQLTLTTNERAYLLASGHLAAVKFLQERGVPNLDGRRQLHESSAQTYLNALK